jgi:hypothetical protein
MVDALVLAAAVITVGTAFAQIVHMAWKRGFDAGLEQRRREDEREVMRRVVEELSRRTASDGSASGSDDRTLPPEQRHAS